MATTQRDLTPKRKEIIKKIYDPKEDDLDVTPCPDNKGIHQISNYYWGKKDNETCGCLNCSWKFQKFQQSVLPSGLIQILPK